tara:strand:+ start:8042 stop:8497 length:456 start_codon:yes stop_codon:yes gene_type:complete
MAVTISFFDSWIFHVGQQIRLDEGTSPDTFVINLYSTSATWDATDTITANLVGATQVASASGYTQDTMNLAFASSVSWTNATSTTTFDADDVTWTATGGTITADSAEVYDTTPTVPADPLMCFISFGATNTAGDGTDFKITWNVSGLFDIA